MTNGPPNPGPALSAVRADQDALNAAILLTAQRQNQLTTDINAARELLSEATNAEQALRGAAPATAEMTATGIEKSAAALKGSCDLLRAVGLESEAASSVDEWKECRTTIDRCDKILVDLRKTGFGFVTAVVGVAAYLFKDTNDFDPKASLLAMLVLLIVTLYLVDLAHQTFLGVSVKRAETLEGRLGFTLTRTISEEFAASWAVSLGFALYFILLGATSAIFWFSVPTGEGLLSGHHMTTCGAFLIGAVSMVVGLLFSRNGTARLRRR
jgi:hypothetical protein